MKDLKIISKFVGMFSKMQHRSKGVLFWFYFFPIFIFVFLGYIFGDTSNSKINKLKIGFDKKYEVNTPYILQNLEKVFDRSNFFKVIYIDKNEVNSKLINSKIYGFISLNEQKNKLIIYISKKNQQVNQIITSMIDNANLEFLKSSGNAKLPFIYETQTIKEKGIPYKYIYFLFAGIIAISLMQNSFFSIPTIIISYRKMGFLKRFLFTPLKKTHFTISLIIQRFTTGIIQTILLFVTGFVVFKIKLHINFISFIISFILGSFTFSIIGFFIAGVIQSEDASNAIAQILNMVLMFTSGVYFPLEFLPKFFLYVAYLNPVYHFTKLLYSSLLMGESISFVIINFYVLIAMFVIFFILTLFTFKYEQAK